MCTSFDINFQSVELPQLSEKQLLDLQQQVASFSIPRSTPLPSESSYSSIATNANIVSNGEISAGLEAIQQGLVGCIILAGGESSRLGLFGPKAFVTIGPYSKKTLLQYLLESIARFSAKISVAILIAPSAAPLFEAAITRLDPEIRFFLDITLLHQSQLPYLDTERKPIYSPGTNQFLAASDGNGGLLHAIKQHQLLSKWRNKGIKYIDMVPIDNPLSMPVSERIGSLISSKQAIICGGIPLALAGNNPTGLFAYKKKQLAIAEYIHNRDSCTGDGLRNTNLWAFTLEACNLFSNIELPIHWIQKQHQHGLLWKGERIVTDIIEHIPNAGIYLVDGASEFSPIKTTEDINKAVVAMNNRDISWMKSAYSIDAKNIELHPKYYCYSKDNKKRLMDMKCYQGYIE